MKSCPVARAVLAALSVVVIGCAHAPPPLATRDVTPSSPAERLARDGHHRAAFVAYLETCAGSAAWDGDDTRRGACASAFELRDEASYDELVRWRDAAGEVCRGATTPAAIAVCRGVAELSLSGPLEHHGRARDALARGCHAHGDYASCLRLRLLGGVVQVAAGVPTSG